MRAERATTHGVDSLRLAVIAVDFGGTLATRSPRWGGDRPVDADAADTLHRLHAAGYGLVLSSNTERSRLPALQAAGVDELFCGHVESHALGVAKPHPAFYRAVIAAAGVEPHRILHVGNRWDKDVFAPRVAGMGAAYICPNPAPAGHLAAEVIRLRRFADLPDELGDAHEHG